VHARRSASLVLTLAVAFGLCLAGSGDAVTGRQPLPREFDLTRPNAAFFDLLRRYTDAARDRQIVTLVALYNVWMNNEADGWRLNPFNPRNNVNRETDVLTSQDVFVRALGKAVAGDVSTPTQQFLRQVWQTLTSNVAQHTSDLTLLQPLSEDFKDEGQFDKPAFYRQTAAWWGKGGIVDNVRRIGDEALPLATYKDVHDSRERPTLLRPRTIVNTDDTCTPPISEVITRMARAAVARGSSYLVYDCQAVGNEWNPRILDALSDGLGGVQPAVDIRQGQGSLVGYGFPDVWINLAASGKAEAFLDALQHAGGNLTFALIVLNPSIGRVMPWREGT